MRGKAEKIGAFPKHVAGVDTTSALLSSVTEFFHSTVQVINKQMKAQAKMMHCPQRTVCHPCGEALSGGG